VPEGDTVWRAARRLDRALSGKLLTRTDVRVPAYATWDLSGAAVVDTVSRGKHLLTRIDAEEHWTLHTHLKMEGSWRVLEPGQRWPRPGHTARIVLETDDVVAVGFQLGIVEIVARDREPEIVGHLGPDLLGPDWDADEAVRRLHEHAEAGSAPPPTGPATDGTVGGALLDQRCLAGLGTVYMCEVLFLAGVSPLTRVREVPDLAQVVRLAHRLLTFNAHGRHAAQVTTGNPRRGEEHYVYRRTGQPCRRCGTTIVTAMVGPPTHERRTYWCPHCQPERSDEIG
jgi:endonuclease-8